MIFSTAMDSSSITTSTVKLMQGSTPVAESVALSGDGFTATIMPSASLSSSTTYWISVTTGATAGSVPLATAYGSSSTSQFTTVGTAPTVPSILPSSGLTGGGTPVAITGTGFVSGATVTIGGVAATRRYLWEFFLDYSNHSGRHGGAQNVVVTNPDSPVWYTDRRVHLWSRDRGDNL